MGWGRAVGVGVSLLVTIVVATGCTAPERVGAPSETASTRSAPVSARAPSAGTSPSRVRSDAAASTVIPDPASPSTVSPSTVTSRTVSPTTVSPTRSAGSTSSPTRSTPSGTAASKTPTPLASVALPTGVAEEASGLTPAGDGAFWTVDDATGTGSLIAIDQRGRRLGSLQVDGMSAGNAEALSSGPCSTGSAERCLYVGDLGDHTGRDHVTVYRVPEPASTAGDQRADGTAWRYTYADGPRNAESMLITPDGSLVVIDKPLGADDGSLRPHHVYRGSPGGGVLTLVGTFVPPRPALPLQSMFEGNVVTDAALQVSAGRTRVLVQFYDQVRQYTAPQPSADPALFFRWPQVALPDPDLIQAEGIAPLADGCGFASISEAGPGGSVARLSVAPCR